MAWVPQEELGADALLQQFDLIADGSLRHAELARGLGEGQMSRHRFEDAGGGKGRKLKAHKLSL